MSAIVRSEDVRISPHTGRNLAVLEVQCRFLSDEASREAMSRALREGTVTVRSTDGRGFTVGNSTVTYTGDSPVTTVTMNLEENEQPMATAVRIGDRVTVTPERYKEEYREEAVFINMIVRTTGTHTDGLEAAINLRGDEEYFPVVREGLRAEPLAMRFGKCVWRDESDGSRLHYIVLVERSYDEARSPFPGINEPELTRAQEAIASLQMVVDAFGHVIVNAGLMTAGDLSALRAQAENVTPAQLRQFDRTKYVDDFWTENSNA